MLSRIAESLYWMSRYLERADNTARLMEINLLYLVEAEEHLSEAVQWRPLVSISGSEAAFAQYYDGFGVDQTARLVADTSGLFISNLEVGRWVQAGDRIGHVYDGFDGALRAEVKTPVSGLLSGIRRQPLLFEGDLIARVQTRHRFTAAMAPRHGVGQ
jgi:A predicted alpha-helical domain with a conserved ER motif.